MAAVMSLLGAAPAAATTYCEALPKGGECKSPYPESFGFKGTLQSGKAAEFTAGGVTVKCTGSTLAGEVSENPAEGPLPGQVTSLTFSGCTASGFSCSATALNLPYSLQIAALSEPVGDGTLSFGNGGKGAPTLKVECAFLLPVACVFEIGEEAKPTLKGGTPATISIVKLPLGWLGGPELCGEEPLWSGPYTIVEAAGMAKPPGFVAEKP